MATSGDRASVRERHWHKMRDHVLFEYGLFSGPIGRTKCGLLVPYEPEFRVPSDFLGVACFTHASHFEDRLGFRPSRSGNKKRIPTRAFGLLTSNRTAPVQEQFNDICWSVLTPRIGGR